MHKHNNKIILGAIIVIALFTGLAIAGSKEKRNKTTEAHAEFVNTQNENIGFAHLRESPNGVLIQLDLKNLPPGELAIHIHEKADCTPIGDIAEDEDHFTNTGGHFNPHGDEHGFMNPKGAHAGDLPNITIAEDGTFRSDLFNSHIGLNDYYDRANIFDKDGAAFIIHEGADDYMEAHTGNAGARIACAVIKAL